MLRFELRCCGLRCGVAVLRFSCGLRFAVAVAVAVGTHHRIPGSALNFIDTEYDSQLNASQNSSGVQ